LWFQNYSRPKQKNEVFNLHFFLPKLIEFVVVLTGTDPAWSGTILSIQVANIFYTKKDLQLQVFVASARIELTSNV
jgi:hypothetical protein